MIIIRKTDTAQFDPITKMKFLCTSIFFRIPRGLFGIRKNIHQIRSLLTHRMNVRLRKLDPGKNSIHRVNDDGKRRKGKHVRFIKKREDPDNKKKADRLKKDIRQT